MDKRLLDKLKASKIKVNLRELKKPWETAIERLKEASEDANKVKSPTDGATPSGAAPAPSPTTGN